MHFNKLCYTTKYCSILGEGYPCFELSAVNADKPPLTVSEIKQRVKQFEKVGEVNSLPSDSQIRNSNIAFSKTLWHFLSSD